MTGSRFNDMYESELPYQLWEQTVKNALSGKRGQKALADLEAALLALPEKKLISGSLCEDGQVCAVGAYVRQCLIRKGVPLEVVDAEMENRYTDSTFTDTVLVAKEFGMTGALANMVSYQNDEGIYFSWADESPEARYERMLSWVRSQRKTT